jgi:predicted alpha/beta-fold hydrolase
MDRAVSGVRAGVVSIDWVDSSLELPPNAPLLAVLPTLCGSAQTHRAWLRGLSAETGFRVAVLNRRGHGGLTLRTPRFNVFGDPTDTRLQLEHIRQAFPESTFLGAIGISAGSAQVATYLGTSGADSLVDAAVCACPAYDISTAFGFLTMGSPRLDGLLLRSVQSHWLEGESGCTLANAADLDPAAAEALRQARQASTMEEFVEAHTYFAGCADGAEQYYEEHNPMSHFQSIAKPVLLLNAGDDPVSLHATIPTEVPVHGAALVQTAFGSHAAFVDGVYLERSWMMDVSTAFLKECSLALAAPSTTHPSDR